MQVLQRCNFSVKEDQLICLGDYVDGWSQTAEVIEYLLKLEEECVHKPIFLRGNHDAWCQEWLNFGIAKDIWVVQGGKATIDSYIRTGLLTDKRHKEFFNKLHNYYVDEENRGFVQSAVFLLSSSSASATLICPNMSPRFIFLFFHLKSALLGCQW